MSLNKISNRVFTKENAIASGTSMLVLLGGYTILKSEPPQDCSDLYTSGVLQNYNAVPDNPAIDSINEYSSQDELGQSLRNSIDYLDGASADIARSFAEHNSVTFYTKPNEPALTFSRDDEGFTYTRIGYEDDATCTAYKLTFPKSKDESVKLYINNQMVTFDVNSSLSGEHSHTDIRTLAAIIADINNIFIMNGAGQPPSTVNSTASVSRIYGNGFSPSIAEAIEIIPNNQNLTTDIPKQVKAE